MLLFKLLILFIAIIKSFLIYHGILCLLRTTIVNDNKTIQCDSCNCCNKLNYVDHKYLQSTSDPSYCTSCCSSVFPFNAPQKMKFFIKDFFS